jgi:hypothetical protein
VTVYFILVTAFGASLLPGLIMIALERRERRGDE